MSAIAGAGAAQGGGGMTMVENVAKALYEIEVERAKPAAQNLGCKVRSWDDSTSYERDHYIANARAAIEAMRAPTEEMLDDGAATYDHPSVYMGGPSSGGRRMAERIHRAMIAAALGEP